jgi:hypothetical protein
VIALTGYDGVEEVAERVRVLDRSDRDVRLHGPARDLDDIPRGLPVTASEAIAVLHPQLGRAVARTQLGSQEHCVRQSAALAEP